MGVSTKRTIVISVACCALVLGAAAHAAAAPTWLSRVKLSPAGQEAEKPQVVTDAHGDALAVWERLNGGNSVIEAANRPAGSGPWQAPATVSAPGKASEDPQVGIDAQGDAVAVWSHKEGSEFVVEAAVRTGFGGTWQAAVALSMPAPEPAPQVAVDAKGDAVVVWRRQQGSTVNIEAASRPAGSGAWQAPVTVSTAAVGPAPARVAIDAQGDATAVWEQDEGLYVVIEAATGQASSGKWQPPARVSPLPEAHNANEPRVAADAQGDVVAVWERFNGEEIIEAATNRASSGKWQAPVALTEVEPLKGEPGEQQVTLDGRGDAVVVWQRFGKNATIEATTGKLASGSWQPSVVLSQAGENAYEPEVSAGAQGGAVAVWRRSNGTNEIAEAAAGQAASGSWQPPIALSETGGDALGPQVAVDSQGDAAAIWRRYDGKERTVEAAGYDAAGPLLDSLAIPGGGTAGQTLSFSISPFDVWSALGATSWSFGDGTSQSGASVTHAYSTAGNYNVTVRSADVLGNATSASATVAITAPTPVPTTPSLAPRISGARLSHARFRVARRATAISAKAPLGTIFHFTLSQAATLQITFTRSAPGLRGGKRCLAPSATLRRKHAKGCPRTLVLGTLTRAGERQGADSLVFSGRIGARALSPHAYRAVLSASSAGLRSAPVTLSLTVVR